MQNPHIGTPAPVPGDIEGIKQSLRELQNQRETIMNLVDGSSEYYDYIEEIIKASAIELHSRGQIVKDETMMKIENSPISDAEKDALINTIFDLNGFMETFDSEYAKLSQDPTYYTQFRKVLLENFSATPMPQIPAQPAAPAPTATKPAAVPATNPNPTAHSPGPTHPNPPAQTLPSPTQSPINPKPTHTSHAAPTPSLPPQSGITKSPLPSTQHEGKLITDIHVPLGHGKYLDEQIYFIKDESPGGVKAEKEREEKIKREKEEKDRKDREDKERRDREDRERKEREDRERREREEREKRDKERWELESKQQQQAAKERTEREQKAFKEQQEREKKRQLELEREQNQDFLAGEQGNFNHYEDPSPIYKTDTFNSSQNNMQPVPVAIKPQAIVSPQEHFTSDWKPPRPANPQQPSRSPLPLTKVVERGDSFLDDYQDIKYRGDDSEEVIRMDGGYMARDGNALGGSMNTPRSKFGNGSPILSPVQTMNSQARQNSNDNPLVGNRGVQQIPINNTQTSIPFASSGVKQIQNSQSGQPVQTTQLTQPGQPAQSNQSLQQVNQNPLNNTTSGGAFNQPAFQPPSAQNSGWAQQGTQVSYYPSSYQPSTFAQGGQQQQNPLIPLVGGPVPLSSGQSGQPPLAPPSSQNPLSSFQQNTGQTQPGQYNNAGVSSTTNPLIGASTQNSGWNRQGAQAPLVPPESQNTLSTFQQNGQTQPGQYNPAGVPTTTTTTIPLPATSTQNSGWAQQGGQIPQPPLIPPSSQNVLSSFQNTAQPQPAQYPPGGLPITTTTNPYPSTQSSSWPQQPTLPSQQSTLPPPSTPPALTSQWQNNSFSPQPSGNTLSNFQRPQYTPGNSTPGNGYVPSQGRQSEGVDGSKWNMTSTLLPPGRAANGYTGPQTITLYEDPIVIVTYTIHRPLIDYKDRLRLKSTLAIRNKTDYDIPYARPGLYGHRSKYRVNTDISVICKKSAGMDKQGGQGKSGQGGHMRFEPVKIPARSEYTIESLIAFKTMPFEHLNYCLEYQSPVTGQAVSTSDRLPYLITDFMDFVPQQPGDLSLFIRDKPNVLQSQIFKLNPHVLPVDTAIMDIFPNVSLQTGIESIVGYKTYGGIFRFNTLSPYMAVLFYIHPQSMKIDLFTDEHTHPMAESILMHMRKVFKSK